MQKDVRDYIPQIQQKFPMFTWTEIYNILSYGLKIYSWVNKMRCDVLLCHRSDDVMTMFQGMLGYDTLKHYKRWMMKWRMKERILYTLKQKKWDGYYYIGLYDWQHAEIKKQHKRKTFRNVYFTKIKNELHHAKYVKYIWRVPFPTDCGWKFFIESFSSDKAEFVEENNYEKYHQCFLGRYNNGPESVDDAGNSSNECA